MAPADRDTILRRRALFLGAALAQVQPSAGAQPAPLPQCAPADASPQDIQTASELYRAALLAKGTGDFPRAIDALTRAYQLSGKNQLLLSLADVLTAADQPANALRRIEQYIACSEAPNPEVEARLAEAKRQVARLSLTAMKPELRVELDGAQVPVGEATQWLDPGEHTLVVISRGDRSERRFVVTAGEEIEIDVAASLPRSCDTDPAQCMPCLSPPPPPPNVRTTHLGVELGHAAWLSLSPAEGSSRLGQGLRLVLYASLPLNKDDGPGFALRLGPTVTQVWTPDGDFTPLGADVQLGFGSGLLTGSAGLGLGYTATPNEPASARFFTPSSGFFMEPYFNAAVVRLFEPLQVGLRVGHYVGHFRSTRDEQFGLGHINVGLWLSLALTPDCSKDYEETPCRGRGLFSCDSAPTARGAQAWRF